MFQVGDDREIKGLLTDGGIWLCARGHAELTLIGTVSPATSAIECDHIEQYYENGCFNYTAHEDNRIAYRVLGLHVVLVWYGDNQKEEETNVSS